MDAPKVTAAELQEEQRIQAQFSDEEKLRRQEKRTQTRLQMEERLQRVFAPIAQAGMKVCNALHAGAPESNRCVFEAHLADPEEARAGDPEDDIKGVNAFADGEKIVVNPAMMRFASDDNELAFVLSHELSHNILRHPQSTTNNAIGGMVVGTIIDVLIASRGIDTGGAFSKIGGNAAVLAYSTDFEAEADYVGLYIMAGTKYDYANAANFWRRMSARDADAIYISTTHPTNPERFVAMQKTVEEIRRKKLAKLPLLPDAVGRTVAVNETR